MSITSTLGYRSVSTGIKSSLLSSSANFLYFFDWGLIKLCYGANYNILILSNTYEREAASFKPTISLNTSAVYAAYIALISSIL